MSDHDRGAPGAATFDHSIATEQFAAARARIGAQDLADPRRPVPFAYRPPAHATTPPDPAAPPSPAAVAGERRAGPLTTALARLDAGETSCKELIDASFLAIDQHDPALNAIVTRLEDSAYRDAERLDGELRDGRPRRPLHGIPLTVKDVIDVGGVPTYAGSAAYHDLPPADAIAVRRLRDAGAIIIAKTTTHEFALGVTNPQSRNPHDVTRIPGGSSGGSTIAVATGMGLGSLGTDTRASIRVPAALSGTVGFKPTFGAVPTTGVVSLSWTMDHVAPLAASVVDAAVLLDVLAGAGSALLRRVPVDTVDLQALRIGVPDAGFAGAQPAVAAQVRGALDLLSDAGASVEDAVRPTNDDFEDANALGLLISRAEAATFHRARGTDLDRCWAEVADQLRAAGSLPAVEYLAAQRLRGELAAGLLGVFDTVDVLAMPTTLVTAPPLDDFADYLMVLSRNAIPWSLVGFPAISVPCGHDELGLPIGLQLVAPPGREDILVRVGRAHELLRG